MRLVAENSELFFKCLVNISSLTYLLHGASPSSEANWFAASQEIPRILRNPKVHYRTQKRPPPVSILGQPNPVHIPTSHLLEIHPNIIHPSRSRSSRWSTSLRFPQQDPIHPPLLTHTRHMPSPSHSSRFYHPYNMGEECKSLTPCYAISSIPPLPRPSPVQIFSSTPCEDEACHTDTTPASHTETPAHIETRTHNQCGDTIEKSQAPDDGCINFRNMSSIEVK